MPYLDSAVFTPRLEPQNAESIRDDHSLLAVVRRRDTFKQFQPLKCCRPPSSLMGNHSPNGLEKDFGRSAVMEGTGFAGVDDVPFVEEIVISQLAKVRLPPIP